MFRRINNSDLRDGKYCDIFTLNQPFCRVLPRTHTHTHASAKFYFYLTATPTADAGGNYDQA